MASHRETSAKKSEEKHNNNIMTTLTDSVQNGIMDQCQGYGSTSTTRITNNNRNVLPRIWSPSPMSTDSSSWESRLDNDAEEEEEDSGDNDQEEGRASTHLLSNCYRNYQSSDKKIKQNGVVRSSSKSEMVDLSSRSITDKDCVLIDSTKKKTFFGTINNNTNHEQRVRSVWSIVIVIVIGIFLTSSPKEHDLIITPADDAVYPNGVIPRARRLPFSRLDPVNDLGLYNYVRANQTSPPVTLTGGVYGKGNKGNEQQSRKNYPTNAWYQNLLLVRDNEEPGSQHRAYSIPYIVDVVGTVPGLRVHANHPGASSNVVQLNIVEQYGLTIGAARDSAVPTSAKNQKNDNYKHQYTIHHATPLSVTLAWEEYPMKSTISKGMPYATMVYETIHSGSEKEKILLPTIASEISLAQNPIIFQDANGTTKEISCHSADTKSEPIAVDGEIELFFRYSDFSWLVFLSEPVYMQCILDGESNMGGPPGGDNGGGMKLQVTGWKDDKDTDRKLVMRIALNKLCTSGRDPIYCHQEKMHPTALLLGQGFYDEQLRSHAHLYPGPNTAFDYEFIDDNNAILKFDWDVQDMRDIALHPKYPLGVENDNENQTLSLSNQLITYALPHHFDMIVEAPPTDSNIYCVSSLVGPACLYEGSKWNLKQYIPEISFTAPRPLAPWSLTAVGDSLKNDIKYMLPKYMQSGIGDTYFSGKMLAKLGRILLIADEVTQLCTSTKEKSVSPEYGAACNSITIPDAKTQKQAINHLKRSVEVWINGSAVVPFVYDPAWGGVVSCGCIFDSGTGTCKTDFPYCPGFDDPGLNFGNAFYNDVHFHYGYHIYGAAVAAYFDPEWGRNMWEQVLLLIRCIANPSDEDQYFPTWRHKDWYQGHSWASGIAMVFPNGKNQESSSEAIAAYEAVALYGRVMVSAWKDFSVDKMNIAKDIESVGKLLTASEVRAAQTYWHVKKDTRIKIYPSVYSQHAIGILWQTMAQFQTWFGNRPYLALGIQLLPLTPIAEFRDSLPWSKQMYMDYADSCEAEEACTSNGWSVLQLAILATVGHPQDAIAKALALPAEVFESAGGNGHSLTNTLWFIATRRVVIEPLALTDQEKEEVDQMHYKKTTVEVNDCGQPDKCTNYVLDTVAGVYTCRQRMNWLMQERTYTEKQACYQIAVEENPSQCGACDPEADVSIEIPRCTPCTEEQCQRYQHGCPEYPKTFVCTDGYSANGCADAPWDVPTPQCSSCCELSYCSKPSPAEERAKRENSCPPCTQEICSGWMNQCPINHGTQYLCTEGESKAGCSAMPWDLGAGPCAECCMLVPGCEL